MELSKLTDEQLIKAYEGTQQAAQSMCDLETDTFMSPGDLDRYINLATAMVGRGLLASPWPIPGMD